MIGAISTSKKHGVADFFGFVGADEQFDQLQGKCNRGAGALAGDALAVDDDAVVGGLGGVEFVAK